MAKKVLIVDDSALVRKQLTEIISTLEYEIDIAKNGQEAVDKATKTQYDVITMDINMPVMDGLEAVRQIMKKQPSAILMVSSLTTENASITMDALDLGAIDYIPKPGTMNVGKIENREEILQKVKSLSRIPKRRLQRQLSRPAQRERKVVAKKLEQTTDSRDIQKVVLIGSSTGGPGLIEQICSSLPQNFKHPVCIVQHMPEQFTKTFAARLDRSCVLNVIESAHNMELLPGNVYVARGGVHMNFSKKTSGKVVIREDENKGNNFFQPSANDMMHSALSVFNGPDIIGVILTGIGDDGADAMVELKKAGAYTLGESEESATVYGMPKEAYERGGVSEQLDFPNILKKIVTLK
ncbi:response regulator receiver modulated CheB methylesterase [Sulfurimonas gotlandica GD1]|uniref:Protein-glutamate methylesterase/protein-glutamine glutaminase n=1 Tax=Sulfurimonas gotlandica (strain DSM 19862 / JCM 16533 / GD1) TaxID=929558 RepID=B6BNV7_SULGG|nr:chemotaxis response regulator protein-glutamate methylesterase [Sulfurimonas gotlandica]EDZ61214.1 protein-glutamate methylesterase CheB [Sulfurimonas gotlandica GD1]EHP28911.1 response regulator receiver modulated CheB methylesterase [Sulfurimonas gotlandica GD1]